MKMLSVGIVVAVLLGLVDLALAGSKMAGRLVAEWDISRGRPTLRHAGLAPPWNPHYERILTERYGIRFDGYTGCTLDEPRASYMTGYSEVIHSWAERKYHQDIFLAAMYEAGSVSRPVQ